MNETKKLIQQITEGIQDKKGKKIVIADLTKIDDTLITISSSLPKWWLKQKNGLPIKPTRNIKLTSLE